MRQMQLYPVYEAKVPLDEKQGFYLTLKFKKNSATVI